MKLALFVYAMLLHDTESIETNKYNIEYNITMATTIQQAKRVGGSLMVRIPADIVSKEGIREGEDVEIEVRKVKKSYFGAFPKVGPFRKEDRARSKYD